jgi:two-component SAPR family response regulator
VVLAVLLLNANGVVPVGALIDALWDDAPPSSARVTLQGYVSRLRQNLGVQAGQRIVTRSPGYLMVVGDGELDLDRFTRLCEEARSAADGGDWLRAAGLLREALSLWRGDPLEDVPAAAVQRTERCTSLAASPRVLSQSSARFRSRRSGDLAWRSPAVEPVRGCHQLGSAADAQGEDVHGW